VADNENWVGSVAIVTSLLVEDRRIVFGSPERVKTLSSKILSRLFTHQLPYSERKKGLFPRELRGWGVKMTIYLYPVRRLRSYSLPDNILPCTEAPVALTRGKCGRNKEQERARRRWSARLKGMYM
jgi:hypothetical protein